MRQITIDAVTITYHRTEFTKGDITNIVPEKVAQRWCDAGFAHFTTPEEHTALSAKEHKALAKEASDHERKAEEERKKADDAFKAEDAATKKAHDERKNKKK